MAIHVPLRVFIEVAECGNFSEAAKRLHVTQSAVSQHIRNLEEDLHTVLIDRNNRRSIRLTSTGQIVFEYARRILQIENEMRSRIEDTLNVTRGVLTIGASYTVGDYILPTVISEFWDLYPEIEHHIEIYNTPAVVQAVSDRRIDVGLVESTVHNQNTLFHVEEVALDRMVLIVPLRHRLAGRSEATLEHIMDETWIVREAGSGTREFTDHLFDKHGIRPKRMMAFSSTQGVKEAVRAGLGIALISSWALRTESTFRTVQIMRLKDIELSRPLFLITQTRSIESKAARTWSDYVRRWFTDHTNV